MGLRSVCSKPVAVPHTDTIAGSIASITLFGVPTARAVQQSSAYIWHGMFLRGMNVMPKVAIAVGLSYGYAAYETHRVGGDWKGFLAAGGLVVSIVPFTLLFMSSTNASLISAAKGSSALAQAQVSQLIENWGYLNLARSLLPLAGAVTGLVTFLKNVS